MVKLQPAPPRVATKFHKRRLALARSAMLVSLLVTACNPPPVGPSKPVSLNPFPGDPNLDFMQSEQSVARFYDGPSGRRALSVGYNDGRGFDPDRGKNKTADALSLDDGDSFIAGLLPVVFDFGSPLSTLNGDPWMATNLAHDRVYYSSLARTASDPSASPNAIALSVRDATPGGWHAPYPDPGAVIPMVVNVIGIGHPGIDQSKVAVSQDAREDVYLSYTCPTGLGECIGEQNRVNVIRLRDPDRVPEPLGFDTSLRVDNPIVATDAREPNAVFVAYQLLTSPSDMDIAVARSDDGGSTWPAVFRQTVVAGIHPDQRIKAFGLAGGPGLEDDRETA